MRYFDKLTRRLAGRGFAHTLRPELHLWEELYDPFENTAVLPLTYPSAVKRTVAVSVKPGQILYKPLPTKKPLSHSGLHRVQGKQQKGFQRSYQPVLPDVIEKNQTVKNFQTPADIKPLSHKQVQTLPDNIAKPTLPPEKPLSIVKRSASSAHQDTQPMLVKTLVEAVEHEKVVPPGIDELHSPTTPTEPLRRRSVQTNSLEPKVAPVVPLSTFPENRPSRKRKARALKEAGPTLTIGRMKVDVVPVKAPARPPVQKRVVATDAKGRKSAESSKQAQKLGFGLGQM